MSRRSRTTTVPLGTCTVTYTPHHLPGVGPRVLMIVEERDMRCVFNLSPTQARQLGMQATLAAGEAEAIANRETRQRGAA